MLKGAGEYDILAITEPGRSGEGRRLYYPRNRKYRLVGVGGQAALYVYKRFGVAT